MQLHASDQTAASALTMTHGHYIKLQNNEIKIFVYYSVAWLIQATYCANVNPNYLYLW